MELRTEFEPESPSRFQMHARVSRAEAGTEGEREEGHRGELVTCEAVCRSGLPAYEHFM